MPTEDTTTQDTTAPSAAAPSSADIGNIVNAAVTAHLKRSLGKAVAEAMEAALKPVKEQLEKAQAPVEAAKAADPKASPEFAAMQRQLEELHGKLKSESDARSSAEKRQREDRAYSDLRSGLAAAGIKADMVDIAADNLFYAKKRVTFDENGVPLFKSTRSTSYGDEEELLPLSSGIQAYAKSKEAAPFLPSPATSKAPPIPGRTPSGGAGLRVAAVGTAVSDDDKIANAMARANALKAQFGDG